MRPRASGAFIGLMAALVIPMIWRPPGEAAVFVVPLLALVLAVTGWCVGLYIELKRRPPVSRRRRRRHRRR